MSNDLAVMACTCKTWPLMSTSSLSCQTPMAVVNPMNTSRTTTSGAAGHGGGTQADAATSEVAAGARLCERRRGAPTRAPPQPRTWRQPRSLSQEPRRPSSEGKVDYMAGHRGLLLLENAPRPCCALQGVLAGEQSRWQSPL